MRKDILVYIILDVLLIFHRVNPLFWRYFLPVNQFWANYSIKCHNTGHLIGIANRMTCLHITCKNIETAEFYGNIASAVTYFCLARSYKTFILKINYHNVTITLPTKHNCYETSCFWYLDRSYMNASADICSMSNDGFLTCCKKKIPW